MIQGKAFYKLEFDQKYAVMKAVYHITTNEIDVMMS